MKPSLREMLEDYKNETYYEEDWDSREGFQDAVGLLMPCLEALEKYEAMSQEKNPLIHVPGFYAKDALEDLRKKLEV